MKKSICIILVLLLTSCTSVINGIHNFIKIYPGFSEIYPKLKEYPGFSEIYPKLKEYPIIVKRIKKIDRDMNNVRKLIKLGIIEKPLHFVTYDGDKIQSEEEIADDQKTRNQAVAIYTVGGAALGAALGQAIGKDTKSTLYGAGFGAAGGYLIGKYEGENAVNEKKRIEKERKQIKKEIEKAQRVNYKIRDYNKNLCSEINRLKNFSKADFKRNLKKAKAQYVEAKGLCNMANAKLEEIKLLKKQSQNYQLDIQIAKLKKEISILENQTEQLASLDKRISV